MEARSETDPAGHAGGATPPALVFRSSPNRGGRAGDRNRLVDLWPELAPWRPLMTPLKLPGSPFFLGDVRPVRPAFGHAASSYEPIRDLLDSHTGDGIFVSGDAERLVLFPLGLGTLFYRPSSGRFSIAAHLRDLVPSADGRPSPNVGYALDYVTSLPPLDGRTPFEGCFQVPPGHALALDAGGNLALMDVAPVYASEHAVAIPDFIAAFVAILKAQIEHAAAADGCLTLSLSGGHDSTLLAFVIREADRSGVPLRAITCFDSRFAEGDERDIARATANDIGAELICLDLAEHPPFDGLRPLYAPDNFTPKITLDRYYRAVDAVTPGASILSGVGGDTLFFEFPSYFALLSAIGSPATFLRLCRAAGARQNRLAPLVAAAAIGGWLRAQMTLQDATVPKDLSRIVRRDVPRKRDSAARRRPSFDFRGRAEQLYLNDVHYFLDGLAAGNSAYRVAARSPYLSSAALNALMSIPIHAHLGAEKRVVQRSMLRSLGCDPARIRASKGFLTTSTHVGISAHHEALREMCAGGVLSAYLDPAELSALWDRQLAGSLEATPSLARLIEVESFYRAHGF